MLRDKQRNQALEWILFIISEPTSPKIQNTKLVQDDWRIEIVLVAILLALIGA